MARTKPNGTSASTATIGFEAKLWLTAEQAVPAPHFAEAEYNGGSPQGLLGLIFLKCISDTAGKCRMSNAEIRIRNSRPLRHSKFVIRRFPVPAEARWSHLQASAKQPTIGKTVEDAMGAIERDNPRLKGVLPKDYARPGLDTARRDSALSKRGASPQSLSAAKDNQRSPRRRLPVCLPQTGGQWLQILQQFNSKGG